MDCFNKYSFDTNIFYVPGVHFEICDIV